MFTPRLTDRVSLTRGGPPGGGGTPIQFSATLAQILALFNANGGSGGGVTKLSAGTNITLDPASGLGNVTINASGGGGGGVSTDYLTATNNSGDTVLTPTQAIQSFKVTVGGTARTSNIAIATTGRTAGNKVTVEVVLPAVSAIILQFRNATVGGTQLLPAERFSNNQFYTDGSTLSAVFDFVYTGSAWEYQLANTPS